MGHLWAYNYNQNKSRSKGNSNSTGTTSSTSNVKLKILLGLDHGFANAGYVWIVTRTAEEVAHMLVPPATSSHHGPNSHGFPTKKGFQL